MFGNSHWQGLVVNVYSVCQEKPDITVKAFCQEFRDQIGQIGLYDEGNVCVTPSSLIYFCPNGLVKVVLEDKLENKDKRIHPNSAHYIDLNRRDECPLIQSLVLWNFQQCTRILFNEFIRMADYVCRLVFEIINVCSSFVGRSKIHT